MRRFKENKVRRKKIKGKSRKLKAKKGLILEN
jgi:hypothetical protein